MKITSLNIKNFLTIRSLVELSLENKGLTLIQGENRDDTSASSNGAGKSTIGDSICWCLYGTTARGETGDSIINNIEKKGCCVELVIESEGKVYSIARHRKDKKHKNSLQVRNMTDVTDLTKGTDKLTQELVNKLIGCSYEVFKSAIYAAQDSIPDLPGMTDKFLKQIVEEAAGINRLASAYESAKDYHKSQDVKLMKAESNLITTKDRHAQYEDKIKDLQVKESSFEANRKAQVEKVHLDITALTRKGMSLKLDAGDIDVPETERLIQWHSGELAKDIAKHQSAKDLVTRATSDESIAAKALKAIISEAKSKVGDLKSIENKVGQPCGECGKPYHKEDLSSITTIAKTKLITVKAEINRCKDELADAKEAKNEAADGLLLLDDVSGLISKNKTVVAALRSDLDEVNSVKVKTTQLDKDVSAKQVRCQEINDSENPYKSLIEEETLLAAEAKEKIDDLTAVIKGLAEDASVAKDAVSVFSPAGVRAHVLDTVTPQLNDRTSHYLGTLSDGNISATWNTLSKTKSGELREKFTIEVENDHGASSFGGLSGGEKRKVRLATAMALQDLVSSRASKPIDLWIADEIDDALDDAGLERLMTVLEEKAREKGTVLMISHNSLSDWIREQTTVIKEHHTVTVEGHLVA